MKFNKKIIIDSLLGFILGGGIVYFSFAVMSKELLMKFLLDCAELNSVPILIVSS
jgi:hypothetical protein